MRRRDFIAGLSGAVAWPLVARAQQATMPVIGLLNGISNEAYADWIASVRQGLRQQGFVGCPSLQRSVQTNATLGAERKQVESSAFQHLV
jgi:hypothetical protein